MTALQRKIKRDKRKAVKAAKDRQLEIYRGALRALTNYRNIF